MRCCRPHNRRLRSPPAPSPVSTAARGGTSASGSRARVTPSRAVLVIAAVLVLAVGLILGIRLTGSESQPDAAGQTQSSSDDKPGSVTADDDSPQEPAPPTDVTCWDGTRSASRAACPPVRGLPGMRWLFPSFNRAFGDCQATRLYDGKVNARKCTVRLSDGGSAAVVYSEWGSFALGQQHYLRKYGPAAFSQSGMNVWATAFQKTNYQSSRMFAATFPYSVTFAARSPALVRQAVGLLSVRTPAGRVGYR